MSEKTSALKLVGHTQPGQWSIENSRLPESENFYQEYVNFGGYFGIHGPRVFLAAPDLLEALEYAVSKYGAEGGPWSVPSEPGGWLDRARAAIKKAKGE